MTTPITGGTGAAAVDAGAAPAKPKNTAEAARQFEAMLIEQMLKTAHGGGAWAGEDETASTMTDMAEQQFAQMLANGGGMGLAKLVTQGLDRK